MKNKVITALLSLIIAFGLWIYVINYESKEETYTIENVSVVFQNENALTGRSLMLTGGTDQTVTLTVTGNRSEVSRLNSNNVSVVVDLSRIYDTGEQSVTYTINFPADVSTSSFSTTADKNRITLTVESKVTQRVPVVIDWGEGTVERGYTTDTDTVELSTSHVTVEGPASVVGQMKQALIRLDLTDRTETIDQECEFTLCDSEGNPVEVPNVSQVVAQQESVYVRLLIQPYKVLPLKLEVIDGGGATEETTQITYTTTGGEEIGNITVAGNAELLEGLEEIVLGTIELEDILEDTVLEYPVSLPAGVTNLSGVETVQVSIAFPELMTQTFTVENIQATNVPAGLVAEVVTKKIDVTVRGPKALVEKMQASDIVVSVSFGSISIGDMKTETPTVTISSAYTGVGVLSYGNVRISLEEPVTEPTEEPDGQNLGE